MKILEDFLEAYCVSLNIGVDKLTSKSRKRELVDSRMIFCAVARKHGGYTLTQIGKLLNTHHATVLHAVRSYDDISTYDSSFRTSYVKARGVFDFCDPEYNKGERIHGLIDTIFATNSKLRKLIEIRDARISMQVEEIVSLKNKLKEFKNIIQYGSN